MEERVMSSTRMADSPDLKEARRIVLDRLHGQGVRVFLYGSWVTGHPGRTSDIDIGVLPEGKLPGGLLSEIREALEESTIVYPVDLVDLSEASPSLRERVVREGIPWSD
jgi:predicted nucleotidyltransferase